MPQNKPHQIRHYLFSFKIENIIFTFPTTQEIKPPVNITETL